MLIYDLFAQIVLQSERQKEHSYDVQIIDS